MSRTPRHPVNILPLASLLFSQLNKGEEAMRRSLKKNAEIIE
jgi:hypothetical protein